MALRTAFFSLSKTKYFHQKMRLEVESQPDGVLLDGRGNSVAPGVLASHRIVVVEPGW